MNIFIDRQKFEELCNLEICRVLIGSKLYGTADETSDTDYIVIFKTPRDFLLNPFIQPYQFQYKDVETNTDYTLVDMISFIRNVVNGQSIVSFEAIMLGQFQDVRLLDFLDNYQREFITSNIIQAYLRFARKDVQNFVRCKTKEQLIKKVQHYERCIAFAERLLETAPFELDVKQIKERKDFLNSLSKQELAELFLVDNSIYHDIIDRFELDLRQNVRAKIFTRYPSVEAQVRIFNSLQNIDAVSSFHIPESIVTRQIFDYSLFFKSLNE